MFHLIESTDKPFLEELNSALMNYGVEATVHPMGSNSEGVNVYSVVCPQGSSELGIDLVNYREAILRDLDFQSRLKLRIHRNEDSLLFAKLLTSPKMIFISIASTLALILALALEAL